MIVIKCISYHEAGRESPILTYTNSYTPQSCCSRPHFQAHYSTQRWPSVLLKFLSKKLLLSCYTWIKEDAVPTSTCFCQFLAHQAATTLRIFTSAPPFIKLPHANPLLSPLTLITDSPFPQLNDSMNLNFSPNLSYSSSPELKSDSPKDISTITDHAGTFVTQQHLLHSVQEVPAVLAPHYHLHAVTASPLCEILSSLCHSAAWTCIPHSAFTGRFSDPLSIHRQI